MVFAYFHGVNTPTMADFKLPVWIILQFTTEGPQSSSSLTSYPVLEPPAPYSWKDGQTCPTELASTRGGFLLEATERMLSSSATCQPS